MVARIVKQLNGKVQEEHFCPYLFREECYELFLKFHSQQQEHHHQFDSPFHKQRAQHHVLTLMPLHDKIPPVLPPPPPYFLEQIFEQIHLLSVRHLNHGTMAIHYLFHCPCQHALQRIG